MLTMPRKGALRIFGGGKQGRYGSDESIHREKSRRHGDSRAEADDGAEGSVDILCHSVDNINDFSAIFVVRYR